MDFGAHDFVIGDKPNQQGKRLVIPVGFNPSILEKLCGDLVRDDARLRTHKHGTGQTAIYRFLGCEGVVVVGGN